MKTTEEILNEHIDYLIKRNETLSNTINLILSILIGFIIVGTITILIEMEEANECKRTTRQIK